MDTIQFVGRNLHAGDEGLICFRVVEPYRQGTRSESRSDDKDDQYWMEEAELNAIFEYEHALDGLLWCSLRRRNLETGAMRCWDRPTHWEGRDLKPDAEPISPTELQEGGFYFALKYADEDRNIPVMETLMFIGGIWRRAMSASCISRISFLIMKGSLTTRSTRIAPSPSMLSQRTRSSTYSSLSLFWRN